MRKFIIYAIRWQMSSFILAPAIAIVKGSSSILGTWEDWLAAIIANAVGASIFFWVDRFIFTSSAIEMWHFKDHGICDNCGKEASLWRLTLAPNYDKRDSVPKFLCMECSKIKTNELRKKGIKVRGKSH
jgi:hypothetical protein